MSVRLTLPAAITLLCLTPLLLLAHVSRAHADARTATAYTRYVVEVAPGTATANGRAAHLLKAIDGVVATAPAVAPNTVQDDTPQWLTQIHVITVARIRHQHVLHVLRTNPQVLDIEPFKLLHHTAAWLPNDPLVRSTGGEWWLSQLHVPTAWSATSSTPTTGQGVIVAVLDSGVDAFHPDLRGKVLPGMNVVTGHKGPLATDDVEGHGTHIAGIIAATANNGIGLSGIAPQAQILPVKVDDGLGEDSTVALARALIWATNHHAAVINVSLGSSYNSSIVHRAVRYAVQHDVVVVCAAGNHDYDESAAVDYPAAYRESLAVGAVDSRMHVAAYSDIGTSVDVVAPGTRIVSTSPTTITKRGYDVEDGTSFAAPMVSGVAALLRQRGLTAAQTVHAIVSTAHDLRPRGVDVVSGHGLVDAAAALATAPPLPAGGNTAFPPYCATVVGSPDLEATTAQPTFAPELCGTGDHALVGPQILSADLGASGMQVTTTPATPFAGTLEVTVPSTFTGDAFTFGASDGMLLGGAVTTYVASAHRLTSTAAVQALKRAAAAHYGTHHIRWPLRKCKRSSTTRWTCMVALETSTHRVFGRATMTSYSAAGAQKLGVAFNGGYIVRDCADADQPELCANAVSWSQAQPAS